MTYSGGLFENFLMSALNTAITLEQVDCVSEGIGKDLDLDVARGNQVLLDQARKGDKVSMEKDGKNVEFRNAIGKKRSTHIHSPTTAHLHLVVTEGLHGLTSGGLQHDFEVLGGLNDTHSLSSTSLDGLDQDGVSDLSSLGFQECIVLVLAVVSRDNGDLGSLHNELGLALGSH